MGSPAPRRLSDPGTRLGFYVCAAPYTNLPTDVADALWKAHEAGIGYWRRDRLAPTLGPLLCRIYLHFAASRAISVGLVKLCSSGVNLFDEAGARAGECEEMHDPRGRNRLADAGVRNFRPSGWSGYGPSARPAVSAGRSGRAR
jgi:hypothetical protein